MSRKSVYSGVGTRFVDNYDLPSGSQLVSATLTVKDKNNNSVYISKAVNPTGGSNGFITQNNSVATVAFELYASEVTLLNTNRPYYLYKIKVLRSDGREDFITPAGVIEPVFVP